MANNNFTKEDLMSSGSATPKNTEENKLMKADEDKVVMSKTEFEALEKRLKRLEETANKGRLSNYDKAHEDDKVTIIKLRTIAGKVITSWSDMKTNKAEVDPVTRKVIEDQKVEVTYEDGKTEVFDLVTFNRRYEHLHTVLKEERVLRDQEKVDKFGDRILTLEDKSGKTYEIGVKFVN